jgi:hypothetical protein
MHASALLHDRASRNYADAETMCRIVSHLSQTLPLSLSRLTPLTTLSAVTPLTTLSAAGGRLLESRVLSAFEAGASRINPVVQLTVVV